MLCDKEVLTLEEREFIRLFQEQLKDVLINAKEQLADDEIALVLKEALGDRLKGIIHNV